MIEKIVIAVDFDGVLNTYASGWEGSSAIISDSPNEGAIEWLQAVLSHGGFEVFIHSCRCRQEEGIAAMYAWLLRHGLSRKLADEIVFTKLKPNAEIFLDDHAMQFVGRWPTFEEITSFKPWYKRGVKDIPLQKAVYEDAASEEEAELIQKSEHKCFLCMHGAVCEVANAALRTEMYVTVSRCLSFTEIPAQLVGEL